MNQSDEPGRLTFDEQRALHDLEELQRQIERVRGQRKGAEAEFDQFLRGFRPGERQPDRSTAAAPVSERKSDAVARPATPPTPPPDRHREAVVTTDPPPPGIASEPPGDSQPVAAPAPFFRSVEPPPAQKPRTVRTPAIAAVAALVIVVGFFAVRGMRSAPESQASSSPATTPGEPSTDPPPPQSPESSAATPAASQAAPQSGVNLEIITLKPVWVRVTIDGRRAIERELPPGQRIPVHGERSVLIRAGNAGGIAVRRNGGDEVVLGPEGVIATREYTAGAARGSTPVR